MHHRKQHDSRHRHHGAGHHGAPQTGEARRQQSRRRAGGQDRAEEGGAPWEY